MGRQPYSKRKVIGTCLFVTTKYLRQNHYLDGGIKEGILRWRGRDDSIEIYVSTAPTKESIVLGYVTGNLTRENPARLVSTPCRYGGTRWWFLCPICIDGKSCHRRVSALYFIDGKGFGCRHCHDLTYRSSQESHKADRRHRKLQRHFQRHPDILNFYGGI